MANRFLVIHVMQVEGREGLIAVLQADEEGVLPQTYVLRSASGDGEWRINGWANVDPPPQRGTIFARRTSVGLTGSMTLAPGMVLVDGEGG